MKIIKHYYSIKILQFCSLIYFFNVAIGQKIYTILPNNVSHSIISINLETCEEKVICNIADLEVYELTFHLNGNIFAIGYEKNTQSIYLFEIEEMTCNIVNSYPLPPYYNEINFLPWIGLCCGKDGNIYIGTNIFIKFDYQTKEFTKLGEFNFPFRFVHDMSLVNGEIVMCVSNYIQPIEYSIVVNLESIEDSKISASTYCGINQFNNCQSSDVFFIDNFGLNKFSTVDSLPSLICPLNSIYDWKGLASKLEFLLPLRTLDLGADVSICRAESHHIVIPTIAGDQIRWQDGNTSINRSINIPGTYKVSIITSDGCIITDSITITRSYSKVDKTSTIDLCKGQPYDYHGKIYQSGATIVDSLNATTGCDTLLTIVLRPIPTPTISRDTTTCDDLPISIQGKTYQIGDTIISSKPSAIGCDTLISLVYKKHISSVNGVYLTDSLVCEGSKRVVIFESNHFADLIWSNGDSSKVADFGPGQHFVQAIDLHP